VSAFDALYRAEREKVLALCLHVTGRRADAEDAAQETFLAVHRALRFFRGEAALSTWVYRIALRAALRVRARRRPSEPVDPETPGPSGEAEIASRARARLILDALGRLSAEHRMVLALFGLEGLGHRAIAEVLGVPEGTVWSRLHAARKRLASELGLLGVDPAPAGARAPGAPAR
jgi:RNA polymerase sigma-70 factor (ECF subfamily)